MCHQIPARTIAIGSGFLPICARDTGIYLGFFISFLFLLVADAGRRQNELPSKWVLSIVFFSIGALALDGFSSYLGWRETTNTIRLATGLICGFSLPLLLFPVFNYQVWRRSSFESILKKKWENVVLLLIAVLTFVVVELVQAVKLPLFADIASSVVALSIIFTFVVINLILVTLVPFWYQRAENFVQLTTPLSIAFALVLLELFLSYSAHRYLISLVL